MFPILLSHKTCNFTTSHWILPVAIFIVCQYVEWWCRPCWNCKLYIAGLICTVVDCPWLFLSSKSTSLLTQSLLLFCGVFSEIHLRSWLLPLLFQSHPDLMIGLWIGYSWGRWCSPGPETHRQHSHYFSWWWRFWNHCHIQINFI